MGEDEEAGTERLSIGQHGRYSCVAENDYDPFVGHTEEDYKALRDRKLTCGTICYGVVQMPMAWLNEARSRSVWRLKLGDFLESRWPQFVMAFLLLVDVAVVIAEIVIADLICRSGEEPTHHQEEVEEALHYTSISILSFFCLDLLLTFVAFDFAMFKHLGYIMDTIVIVAALVLELTVSDIAGLLIFLRLWRIVRIVHGANELLHKVEKDLAKRKVKNKIYEIEHYYALELEKRDEQIADLTTKLQLNQTTQPSSEPEEKKEL